MILIYFKLLTSTLHLNSQPLPAADPVRNCETSLDSHLRSKRLAKLAHLTAKCEEVLKQPSKFMQEGRTEAEGRMSYLRYAIEELEGMCHILREMAVEVRRGIISKEAKG